MRKLIKFIVLSTTKIQKKKKSICSLYEGEIEEERKQKGFAGGNAVLWMKENVGVSKHYTGERERERESEGGSGGVNTSV